MNISVESLSNAVALESVSGKTSHVVESDTAHSFEGGSFGDVAQSTVTFVGDHGKEQKKPRS